ncbi:unnamed protein product [Adineta ricciae]|uniref:EF-hand domain-containing protein n=1 Tax=Adineta ricciae TaxID=249248 RepID=A0A814HHA1_ADIRI|nr:unnamed protein product [Adineta ricciae]CAF1010060.1 unnamed protein product [Adineta ricciae]
MGGGSSRRKQPIVPLPSLPNYPQQYPPPSSVLLPPPRPASPVMTGLTGPSSLNRRQLRQYEEAQRTIQNLQSQMYRGRSPSPRSYGGPPLVNASGPSYGAPYPLSPPPLFYGGNRPGTPPPSPILHRMSYPYPHASPFGYRGYRDSDYAAVANISGLNPADIALLHREYLNLTRGGLTKIDRVVFRQLLREALVDANNENIDRAIENIFIAIDRNHDGFIDFPEFVGAFRDVLRTDTYDCNSCLGQYGFPEAFSSLIHGNIANSACIQQPSISALAQPQIISLPPTTIQQTPAICNSSPPIVISVDSNQSPCVVNTQGQCLSGQVGDLQCAPWSIM